MGLIGFETIATDLNDQFAQGRLHHAILICGRQGVGKASFAKDFALKCLGETEKNHPDLLLIEKIEGKRNISVDQIRPIAKFLGKSSAVSRYKFVIIDAADELNRSSSNALLKILEEPSQDCFLILIAHSVAKLLPTIRSRCQINKVHDFSFEEFAKALKRARPKILPPLPDEEIKILSQICNNSVAKALKNGDDLIFLYENWLESLQNGFIETELLRKISDKKLDFDNVIEVMDFFFLRLCKFYMGNIEYFLFNENEVFQDLKAEFCLDKIFEISKKSRDRLVKTKSLNLDKKLTLINIFNYLSAAIN